MESLAVERYAVSPKTHVYDEDLSLKKNQKNNAEWASYEIKHHMVEKEFQKPEYFEFNIAVRNYAIFIIERILSSLLHFRLYFSQD